MELENDTKTELEGQSVEESDDEEKFYRDQDVYSFHARDDYDGYDDYDDYDDDNYASVAIVKWFHKRLGFGFLTNTYGSDIFVHYSSLVVANSNTYRFLSPGEYVEYQSEVVPGCCGKYHAVNVTGIHGGKLMCETLYEASRQRRLRKQQQQKYIKF